MEYFGFVVGAAFIAGTFALMAGIEWLQDKLSAAKEDGVVKPKQSSLAEPPIYDWAESGL